MNIFCTISSDKSRQYINLCIWMKNPINWTMNRSSGKNNSKWQIVLNNSVCARPAMWTDPGHFLLVSTAGLSMVVVMARQPRGWAGLHASLLPSASAGLVLVRQISAPNWGGRNTGSASQSLSGHLQTRDTGPGQAREAKWERRTYEGTLEFSRQCQRSQMLPWNPFLPFLCSSPTFGGWGFYLLPL